MAEDDLGQSVMQQALDFWITPEIEQRRKAGSLPDNFVLTRAQVIINLDAGAPEVRLNEEIKAVAQFRATRTIEKGELITESDVSDISDIQLTDEDPNAGHLTMIAFKGHWVLAFDFRYNAARIAGIVEAAREFLDSATFALKQNHMRSFAENLFGATELMAKGRLLMDPDERLLTSKSHKIITSKYNLEGKLGNTDLRYVDLLNRLSAFRGSARYLDKDLSLSATEAKDMLDTAEDMYKDLRNSAPQRYKLGEAS